MIVADPWLLTLSGHRGAAKEIAGILLQMQIHTSRNSGHLIDLGDENNRRHVRQAAMRGTVANRFVRCSRCGVQAMLGDWLKAAGHQPEYRRLLWDASPQETRRELQHIFPCPGDQMVQDMADWLNVETGE
jgi:hypothetical protein